MDDSNTRRFTYFCDILCMLRGGRTTDRRSRRYATSILCRSLQYTVRCPGVKHAMGEMTRSKYSTFWAIETFGSQRIHLFALKPLNKDCDERGLAAEIIQHVPDEFLVELLSLFNGILQHRSAPARWKKTLFTMLRKNAHAKFVTDFRPIANTRLFCKVFAYMILAQHGFRSGQRTEDHVFVQEHVDCHCGYQLEFNKVNEDMLWQTLHRQNF